MSSVESSRPMDVSRLPRDIFWMILHYLDPKDIVRCRRVSQSWKSAFTNPYNLASLLKLFFPRAKEARELFDSVANNPDLIADGGHWLKTFDRVALRYDSLARGKFRSVWRYKLCDDFAISGEREFFHVQPWESHASHLMRRVDYRFTEGHWTYEENLIVYPSADYHCLVLLDLEENRMFMVPFIIAAKVIRRIRLQKRLLIVEWAEPKAFHWLNDSDGVHRHFASSFEITRNHSGWNIVFRNEWKIMFLGHPLSERDRFHSSHTETHYTIYIWQPNRSLYTADDDAPIESLLVWDISKPSSYRPSLDPTGRLKENREDGGPFIVARFGFRELDFYSVRQRGLPSITRLEVADDAQYIEVTENISTGPVDGLDVQAGWISEVHTTSIPLFTNGPCWRRRSKLAFPPYRGNLSLLTKPIGLSATGALWCTVISEAVDELAGVGYCLSFSPTSWPFDLRMSLAIHTPFSKVTMSQDKIYEFISKGKIYGTERFLIGEDNNREIVVCRFDK